MKAKAQIDHGAFRMQCSVRCRIEASAERVWSLLTDAQAFPRWNSTVTSIEGEIALGQTLAVKVPIDPSRTFKPRVTKLIPGEQMEWSDGFAPMFKGVRTFRLGPDGAGVEFTMTETLSGLMLPLVKRSLPDFAPLFETYARDLKREAERVVG